MDSSVEAAVNNPSAKSKLARTFARVLHLRMPSADGLRKAKSLEKVKDDRFGAARSMSFGDTYEKAQDRTGIEALLAKLFASISSVKAAYAQLQVAQSPYDADGIQAADELLVCELKTLSEIKQCFLKKQFDSSPETTQLLAEIQEQKSLLKSYEITGKKLERELKLKESEVTFLKEKLDEYNKHNRMLEKRLNPSGLLSALDKLHLSGLSPSHFIIVLRHAVKSIRSYVRLLMSEMESADWDLNSAADAIEPGVGYLWDADNRCFAFEAFISREMFDGFHHPNFSIPNESLPEPKKLQRFFFKRFMEFKSVKPMEYLSQKPKSAFAKFCRMKYLQIVHPKMESSFFGSLHQRNLVNAGEFPETTFFASFSEMAKRVWLLHCLAFSFQPEASIFLVRKKCRFSEVYMASVTDEVTLSSSLSLESDSPESDQQVGFTVIPGFRIGKTIIQCQVYLSQP